MQRRIPTKYILTSFLLIGIFISSFAQGNLNYVDQKPIHFGFLLGVNTMDFGVTPSDSVRVSALTPGFSVGIITDLRLNRYLNLRFTPTLHFSERILTYKLMTGTQPQSVVSVQSIPICLPVYLKYSSERFGNARPYLIWGGGMAIDLEAGASAAGDSSKKIGLKPIDFYTEFGVGCDIYFSFFKLCPELKYSIGFNNVLNKNYSPLLTSDKIYTQMLNGLTSRMLTLAFNFE
jgi:hypothetical protein